MEMEIDEANRSAYIWGYIAETLQRESRLSPNSYIERRLKFY